ncbi:mechanosensitive ion channel family protein [Synechocystis salina]|nr:mechanosensitive ion channel family protein [Synechocystis salina]
MGYRLATVKRLILICLLAFTLTVIIPPATAQIVFSAGGTDSSQSASTTPWWDTNKARRCGRLWCSDVFLRGSSQVTFTVGLIPNPEESSQAAAQAIENRAKQVESIFNSIYSRLTGLNTVEIPEKNVQFLRSKVFDLRQSRFGYHSSPGNWGETAPPPPSPPGSTNATPETKEDNQENSSVERRTPTTSFRNAPQSAIRIISSPAPNLASVDADEIHPLTPNVEVGIQNNETVIFVPSQPALGLAQQTIVTVNQADEIINGKPINLLAHEWRDKIQSSFDKALWGHELDRQHPWDRYYISGAFMVVALAIVAIMGLIRSFFYRRDRYLRQELKILAQSITKDIEAESAESLRLASQEASESPEANPDRQGEEEENGHRVPSKEDSFPGYMPLANQFKHRVNHAWQNIGDLASLNLRRQTLLKQRRNFALLMCWTLLWLQISCIFIVGAFIVYVFPSTRPFTLLFIGQAMYFPLLWIGVTLIDKVCGIFVDGFLNNWAKEQQSYNEQSNRYTLRVMTYSPAIKGGISALLTIFGILGTIALFGINPLVLASFGGVAFVLAFLGRNVVEDMLNGTLILWTDRYAIGDVVQIGDVFGLVENMNIYITQLRGPEGRLSTIPNGKISVVQNLTKDWSRAEFIVEIDQSSNVDKALNLIRVVSEQMREDPLWQEKILEPAAILGVDDIASKGIRLQVWIKTQAGQHWPVGREFRLRMKKAFELAGIALGAPQQRIVYHHQGQKSNNSNGKTEGSTKAIALGPHFPQEYN